jgi:hypothetical protein
MVVLGSGSASSRRTIVTALFAAMVGTATAAFAQQAPAPQAPATPAAPAAQEAAPPDPFKFTTDAGAILWTVKADKTADFEAAWKEIRAKLAATDKADLKALGDTLKVFKIEGPASPNGVSYLFLADPASKTLSYSPSPYILFTSGLFADADGRRLFDTINGASAGINPLPLSKVQ